MRRTIALAWTLVGLSACGTTATIQDASTDGLARADSGVDAFVRDAPSDANIPDAMTRNDADADAAGDATGALDVVAADAGREGGSGTDCTFNADCPEAERCECDPNTGCFCHTGVRGTGVSGVDTCIDGNDCASSLCVEGPGGAYYCSGPCSDATQCGPNLPVCAPIAGLGQVCVRQGG